MEKIQTEKSARYEEMLERLHKIGANDAEAVFKKDVDYGSSWKKRGGVGAFFVICRKWDRLEERVQRDIRTEHDDFGVCIENSETLLDAPPYDLFAHIAADPRDEGILDDIRDLRRYLMLVEEEMLHRHVINKRELLAAQDCGGANGEKK